MYNLPCNHTTHGSCFTTVKALFFPVHFIPLYDLYYHYLPAFQVLKKKKRVEKKRVEKKRRRDSEETLDGPAIKVPRKSLLDMAGIDKHLVDLTDLLINKSMDRGAGEEELGLGPRGLLLHGPSGCGKTLLAQAIAGVNHLVLSRIC
jgi:SpoVK/Ycf46/Vps4 family AAA+-type ATPase